MSTFIWLDVAASDVHGTLLQGLLWFIAFLQLLLWDRLMYVMWCGGVGQVVVWYRSESVQILST